MSSIQYIISKILGYFIIGGACIVKFPQIRNFIKAGNADGVNPWMYILETVGYAITFAFNFSKAYPFSTYGENIFLFLQNLVLLYLMYGYSRQLRRFIYGAVVLIGFMVSLFFMPSIILDLLQASTIVLFVASKIPQIITTFREKSTGQLAFITCFMNFAGVMARTFTVLTEVDDPILLMSLITSLLLNGIVVAQFGFYRQTKKQD